jgi:catechol 2,3-dioxygenase-like lactoylglutathione lyase family enzyme
MQLDHAIIAVTDLDAATARYETILGLPVALRSEHPAYGTANALFLFEHGAYLELLAARPGAEGDFVAPLHEFLATHGEGLFGLAATPADMATAVTRLRGEGLAVADAQAGSGVSADGRVRAWRSTRLPPDAWHNSFSVLIEHTGWDWRAELRPQPCRAGSAARAIHHVVFDVPDAEAASATWERRFGLRCTQRIETERMGALVLVHPAGDATVEAVSATRPDGPVAERYARRGEGLSSIAFTVTDAAAATLALRAAGLSVTDPAPGVLPDSLVARIDPASAHGVAAQLIQFT